MSTAEQYLISLPADMAAEVQAAVGTGEYLSPSALVVEALQQWCATRSSQARNFDLLRTDIAIGIADLAAGRTKEFDANAIAERGRTLSPVRSHSG